MRKDDRHADEPKESPLSLSRLREAFAAMLGEGRGSGVEGREPDVSPSSQPPVPNPQPCEINPRSVVEAMLFVGRPDNRPMSSRELAAAMRGVSPAEIDATVGELNALYDADQSPYRIEEVNTGYRLVLREEFERMRDKLYGRVREAKLSPAALEVMSIVAYQQPISVEEINAIRDAPNGAALSTLVRRRLLRIEPAAQLGGKRRYSTTDRFLKMFGLESLYALPRSEELEKV